ncbi:uncharacterized protein LOC111711516 isoform X2 [Eurytemora carolleeae]|uniref:uncharacterized protein LOC111711516 isoform X2 n=1 Tax=Eurytemora carolleeae TaxID=1294199 RepID=UPI000C761253|nr:uncharacterized protein LOC111711516 isoform X2 [Eurytemora carolleeae]|eukprot:XP_023341661.1 uncharacterized protein LOC111711516 isoform X2 [Eurytemora affinis]
MRIHLLLICLSGFSDASISNQNLKPPSVPMDLKLGTDLLKNFIHKDSRCVFTTAGSWSNEELNWMMKIPGFFGFTHIITNGCQVIVSKDVTNTPKCRPTSTANSELFCIFLQFGNSKEMQGFIESSVAGIFVERRDDMQFFHLQFPGCNQLLLKHAILYNDATTWNAREKVSNYCSIKGLPREKFVSLKMNDMKDVFLRIGRYPVFTLWPVSYMGYDKLRGKKQLLPTGPFITQLYIMSDYFGFDFNMTEMSEICYSAYTTSFSGACKSIEDGDTEIYLYGIPSSLYDYANNKDYNKIAYLPIRQPQTRIACPLPRERVSYFTIVNTFTATVWIFILCSIAFVSLTLWMMNRASKSVYPEQDQSLGYIGMIMLGHLFQEELPKPWMEGRISTKMHITVWSIAVFFLVVAWQCDLRAKLVLKIYEDPVNSMDDLTMRSEMNLTLSHHRIRMLGGYDTDLKLLQEQNRYLDFDVNCEESNLITIIQNGSCLTGYDYVFDNKMEKLQRIQGKVTFHVASKPLISYGSIGWYISRHIYFRETFTRMVSRLEDTGISKKILRYHIGTPLKVSEDEPLDALKLQIFYLPLIILAAGIFLGSVSLYLEIMFGKKISK